jgi:uncharacterized membrane protein
MTGGTGGSPVENRVAEDLAKVLGPAWRRHTHGEQRWPYAIDIGAIITLQALLPDALRFGPFWVLMTIELVLCAVLLIANGTGPRLEKESQPLRVVAMVLIGLASAGTAYALIALIHEIVSGGHTGSAGHLLLTGGNVYVINILIFAVWYWEYDRGGPVERALGTDPDPDFLFPQMTAGDMAPKDWEPQFADYFYLAFTNSTAFSPTDVLPFSRMAKMMMLAQSAISLGLAALVVAKAVNALG